MKLYSLTEDQESAVEFLKTRGSGLLAMDMGTGKTLTSIAISEYWNETTLVICPSFLINNWRSEYFKFAGKMPSILESKSIRKGTCNVLIGSYQMVVRYLAEGRLDASKIGTLIIDEAHMLKNLKTTRFKYISELLEIEHKVLLTGTPMMNRPSELFAPMFMLNSGAWGSIETFMKTYLLDKAEHVGSFTSSALRQLKKDMAYFIFRVNNNDRLPALIRERVEIAEFAQNYHQIEKSNDTALVPVSELKKEVAQFKTKWFSKEFGDSDDLKGKKILVFTQYKAQTHALAKALGGIAITGDVDPSERLNKINDFRSEEGTFIFATLPSLVVGANLDWVDEVWFLHLDWVPANHWQGEARLRRMTRDREVLVKYFIATGSFDEYMWNALETKKNLFNILVN